MPFKKGRKKTGGRQKGTANKATLDLKATVAGFVCDNFAHFVELMNEEQTSAKDKAALYIKLMEYVLPKQKEVLLDAADDIKAIKVEFKTTGVKPLTDEK